MEEGVDDRREAGEGLMRVAVTSWTSRRVGGVEEYLSILLPALAAGGVELAVWCEMDGPQDRAPIPLPPGVLSISAEAEGAEASFERLRAWQPDVIYSQGVQAPAFEARLLEIAPSVLFVHTYRGTCISGAKMWSRPVATPCTRTFGWACLAHYFPHRCGGRSPTTMWTLFNVQSRRLELLRRYRAILTHSEYVREEMKRHGLGATVVPYAVPARAVSGSPPTDGAWRLLFVGRMEPLKGGHYLLDALPAIVAAAGRPVHLILAGDGSERERWEQTAQKMKAALPDVSVEFIGWIPQEAVDGLMDQVDLLVVPSLWPEPFAAIGPAAGRHGLPAAAFASGGIPHWLEDGVTGHLAPADPPTPAGLARAVVRCLEDPLHHAALGAAARQMAARFTMERHLPALMNELGRA